LYGKKKVLRGFAGKSVLTGKKRGEGGNGWLKLKLSHKQRVSPPPSCEMLSMLLGFGQGFI
jgi:hypothetical protein